MRPPSSRYQGYEPRAGDTVPVEPASLPAQTMWERYIHPRRPVVLDGLLDDDTWHGTRWTDLHYLKRQAGSSIVRVEPVHPTEDCFGTATPRTTMTFAEYLDSLKEDTAGKYYLTTQYELDTAAEEQESDELDDGPPLDTLLPAPTQQLASDFPRHPRILGHLVLQQCNLWLGNSQQQKSSGLHHDFHDNLYLLLSGHKRFVLFPPSAHAALHVRGEVTRVHENGLLVYEDPGRIRADGLDALDAAHWRVAARARHLRTRAEKRRKHNVQEAYQDAKDAYLLLRETYQDVDEDDAWDSVSGEDAPLAGDDDEDDREEEEEEEEAQEPSEALSSPATPQDPASTPDDRPQEPPSFSLIKPHTLHTHFGIEPPIPAAYEDTEPKVPASSCPAPLVVHLQPGQMLYLPASWFHEVTSAATPDAPHMALNYWMHPPDGKALDAPYQDTEVWDEIRHRVEG